MATLHQVQAAIQSAVAGVTQSVIVGGRNIKVEVAIGWPSIFALREVASKEKQLSRISVYDRKIARNSTRWNPHVVSEIIVSATLTSEISAYGGSGDISPTGGQPTGAPDYSGPLSQVGAYSKFTLEPSAIAVISLGGVVGIGDAVSAIFTACGTACGLTESPMAGKISAFPSAAQVVIGVGGDSTVTMAAKLAAAINGDRQISIWASAAASGSTVILTSLLGDVPLVVQSYVGNAAKRTMEIGRRLRQFQISCWTRTEDERIAVTNPIELIFAELEAVFGLTLADGTPIRLLYVNDHDIEDATLNDVLRRDFFVAADYPITAQDALFSVLAPVPAYSID